MYLSKAFLPTLKENPSEAQLISHRLMLRAGLVRQHSAGIYNWLPMGTKVLKNIEEIIRQEQDIAGGQEIIMPTVQAGDLWKESGRYDDYGPEMLRIVDRHGRDMLYGPTHEEVVTDIFRQNVKSYKDLPINLYQIHWKFRDEVRPRFGVMRGREFLMKDAYSFDINFDDSKHAYNQMFVAYLRIFKRLGLRAIPVRADPGPIGGNMSHEFIVLADTGESNVFCHNELLNKDIPSRIDYQNSLQSIVDDWTSYYAATDEINKNDKVLNHGDEIITAKGIEVGHIFHFGTKYTESMGASILNQDGKSIFPFMGSYGIGVSRLVAAIIEASHDDHGIIWPDSISPYMFGIINLKVGDSVTDKFCEDLYSKLSSSGNHVLYDDLQDRAGVKFSRMDLLGIPWQIILGPKGLAKGEVEIKRRKNSERNHLSVDDALSFINSLKTEKGIS